MSPFCARAWSPECGEVAVVESADGAERSREVAAVESRVLLRGEVEKSLGGELPPQGDDVYEVACRGPAEQREHLVGRDLLQMQDRDDIQPYRWPYPHVSTVT